MIPLLLACAPTTFDDWCEADGITCGTLDVPADWDAPADGDVTLQYLVIAADDPSGAAFTMLNGGPSNGAIDAFTPVIQSRIGDAVRAHHDVVLVDQRGMPHSSPSLACDELIDVYATLRAQDLPFVDREAARVDALLACQARLADEGIDLADYNSLNAAKDLAAVMAAEGYDQYAIWGVSYGTILAQHTLRADPDHVSALVLDSAAPLDLNMLGNAPHSASLAWDALDAACEADPKCADRYDVAADLKAAIAQLDANPAIVTSAGPDGDYDWTLDGEALAQIAAGSPIMTLPTYLPWYVHEIAGGNTDLLASGGVSDLIYDPNAIDFWTYAFRCAEQADLDPDAPAAEGTWPEFDAGFRPVLAQIPVACEALGLDPLPAEARAPVVSDVPTLVISGDIDPVTPRWMAEHLAETLSDTTIVRVPNTGHIASLSPCTFDQIGAFLDGGGDVTCDPPPLRKTGCDHVGGVGAFGLLGALLLRRRR